MLDRDISTAQALHHLSSCEPTEANALDRRRFLQLVGLGLGAGMVAGPGTSLLDSAFSSSADTAWAAGPIEPGEGILLLIGLHGGNDGLNTVVPITDGRYYDQHGALAVPAETTLRIGADTGLHPALTSLKEIWDRGELAIVEGIGYENPDLSHFTSMAKWMSGRPTGPTTSGWVGRWLDGQLSGSKDLFAAAEIGHLLPLHMIGESSRATTIPAARPLFGASDDAADQRIYQTMRTLGANGQTHWQDRIGKAFVDQLDVSEAIAPLIPGELPSKGLAARLEVSARLINANLGFRVLSAGLADFDSHASQPDMHPLLLEELNLGIRRFFEVLDPQWLSRVTVMTYSEFGRTSHSNDGVGTDHGTSSAHFVFGANVQGGFYGQRPSLSGLGRWERMAHHVDFRDYYGSVIDGWLGGGGSDVLGKNISDLGIFSSPPTGGPTFASTAPGDFVPISPVRLIDTRDGTGTPAARIGPEGTLTVRTAGVSGLPASGIRAVVVNVTATGTDTDTYLTLYKRGVGRPNAANLNPTPLRAVGNLVVTGVSDAGEFNVFNKNGSTHCVVDIAGYYTSTAASRLNPLVPSRILDTREGNGAPATRATGGQTIDVVVAGRGGVPDSGVQAVVLNVTAVNPTQSGYITAHAHGDVRPGVSSVNYLPGYDTPNLVMCKVGASGKISLFASGGTLDIVADVVGCYTSTGSQHLSLTPSRILDTRVGSGAPLQRVGAGSEINLQVRGRGGVSNTASAVVLNVTAVKATARGYVTVYPDGVARPVAANLNVGPGQTVPNLVVAKIGDSGSVRLYNHAGTIDLVADVNGFFV